MRWQTHLRYTDRRIMNTQKCTSCGTGEWLQTRPDYSYRGSDEFQHCYVGAIIESTTNPPSNYNDPLSGATCKT